MIDLLKLWKGLFYQHPDSVDFFMDVESIIQVRVIHRRLTNDPPEEVPKDTTEWYELVFGPPFVAFFFPDEDSAKKAAYVLREEIESTREARFVAPIAAQRAVLKEHIEDLKA